MTQDNVLQFKASADMLIDMAIDFSDKGQHLKAVSLLRRALKENPSNADAQFVLARELAELDQFETSCDLYFELLTKNPDDDEVLFGLGENFYALNSWNVAAYYFKRHSDLNPNGYEVVEEPLPLKRDGVNGFSVVYPLTKQKAEEKKKIAGTLIREGKLDEAREAFCEVNEAFPNDSDATSGISFTYLLQNDFENTIVYAQQALKNNPDNVFALSNLATALFLAGRTEECDEVVKKLNSIKTDDPADMFKIATALCEIKQDAAAFDWLNRFVKKSNNYSKEITLLLALAAFNSSNFEECRSALNRLLLFDECNYVAKYYFDFLNQYLSKEHKSKPKRFEYYPQIPMSVLSKRLTSLHRNDFYGIWSNESLLEELNWAFCTLDDSKLFDELVEKISETDKKHCVPYLKQLLLNQNVPLAIKGKILFCLFVHKIRGRFFVVRDGYFCVLDVPKNLPHVIEDDVLLCIAKFSTIFLTEKNFVSRIVSVAKKLQTQILENSIDLNQLPQTAVAVFIARACGFEGVDDKILCHLFNVRYKDLANYTELFDNLN